MIQISSLNAISDFGTEIRVFPNPKYLDIEKGGFLESGTEFSEKGIKGIWSCKRILWEDGTVDLIEDIEAGIKMGLLIVYIDNGINYRYNGDDDSEYCDDY